MTQPLDPIGELLVRAGILREPAVNDLLDLQQRHLPLASLAYALGLADEEALARVLAGQHGVPAVVFDRSVIAVEVIGNMDADLMLAHQILPLADDGRRLLVALERPAESIELLRQVANESGRIVVPHIALQLTLARAIRQCLRAVEAGHREVRGGLAGASEIFVVAAEPAPAAGERAAGVHEEVTREVLAAQLFKFDDVTAAEDAGDELELGEAFARGTRQIDRSKSSETTMSSSTFTPVDSSMGEETHQVVLELDALAGAYRPHHGGQARVLVVDDDIASQSLLVKEMGQMGCVVEVASGGREAIFAIGKRPPDVVLIDIMLPDVGGFQVCRAIKENERYREVGVVLMSAVIDSGRVTEDVLKLYGADDYFEKPLVLKRLKRRLRQLLVARGVLEGDDDGSFQRAMALYRGGQVNEAVAELRRGIEADPISAKHHFVLANLLQKQQLVYEAIEEYEATLELKPDYFPALTRLAYLYYRKGFSAKAIEMWRRALPVCPDPELRQNIEVFMRKLIADLAVGTP